MRPCPVLVEKQWVVIIMRRASEESLFPWFSKEKPLHNGSYEHRVTKIKKQNIILYLVCVCDSTSKLAT